MGLFTLVNGMRIAFALIFAFSLIGCASLDNSPQAIAPSWTTASGWPEVSFKGVQPRELTGLITEQMASLGYAPLTDSIQNLEKTTNITPADDYHSAFIKEIRMGVKSLVVFEYSSLPGRIKATAKPKVISIGVLLENLKPGDPASHQSYAALNAAHAELEKSK